MAELKWDIKRGAGIYRQVLNNRLKLWISTGKIKSGEVVVWRSGFSGWRKPEELEELIPYFRRHERAQLRKIKRRKLITKALPEKNQIKNILIIDDEKDLCQLVGDTLSFHGYNVEFANTKREAMSSLKSRSPDLVFLDLKLPDDDGMKILSKIRKISPATIVNIISAYGNEETREKTEKLGASCFIGKPFTEQELLRSIHSSQDKR